MADSIRTRAAQILAGRKAARLKANLSQAILKLDKLIEEASAALCHATAAKHLALSHLAECRQHRALPDDTHPHEGPDNLSGEECLMHTHSIHAHSVVLERAVREEKEMEALLRALREKKREMEETLCQFGRQYTRQHETAADIDTTNTGNNS